MIGNRTHGDESLSRSFVFESLFRSEPRSTGEIVVGLLKHGSLTWNPGGSKRPAFHVTWMKPEVWTSLEVKILKILQSNLDDSIWEWQMSKLSYHRKAFVSRKVDKILQMPVSRRMVCDIRYHIRMISHHVCPSRTWSLHNLKRC